MAAAPATLVSPNLFSRIEDVRQRKSSAGKPVAVRCSKAIPAVPESKTSKVVGHSYKAHVATSTLNHVARPPSKQDAASIPMKTHPTSVTVRPSRPPPNWNIFQKAAAMALDATEDSLVRSFHHRHRHRRLPRAVDPAVQLSGNFAPVDELPVQQNLQVWGRIPPWLDGVYVRNGANPLHPPLMGHHLFDGDGMIHAVRLHQGSATYARRFTETHRLVQERSIGRPVFPKPIGELHGHAGIARLLLLYARSLFGLVDAAHGMGVANAGLVYFRGHLLAMSEDDLPYHVRVTRHGDLQTVGRYDFDGQLNSTMIAHPKLDPVSRELFALSYDVIRKPHLKYFRFSPDGKKSPDVHVPLETATMVHDFAITEKFIIVPDQQMLFNLAAMIRNASPLVYDSNKISRFGILPKYATDAASIKWIHVPDCFCFHIWNAWEEPGQQVVFICSCLNPVDSIFKDSTEDLKFVLSEIRIDVTTGQFTRRPVVTAADHLNLEAGTVNRNYLGRRTRYLYVGIAEPWPLVSGFAKVDLWTGNLEKFMYGSNRYGGESYFVPNETCQSEDDGYVLTFVHDENDAISELLIVNARDMILEASIRLPSRVPYGFHSTFVTSRDLLRQV